jgi:2',3'-cyclic-nucleotide 2'-phosphodiesterase (5'-nucleotidase family)
MRLLHLARLIFVLPLALLSGNAQAVVLQILHTNDLHAALKTAGTPRTGMPEFGSWARVKAKLDELENDGRARGFETLKFDSGDYLEGSSYYFPDNGIHVLRAYQSFGFDAATVGNHDWLMGARDLDALYGKSPFPFPVVSSNLRIKKRLKNLSQQIRPSASFERGGVRIGVMGLSTDEALYSWITRVKSRKNDMKILDFRDGSYLDPDTQEEYTEQGLANEVIEDLDRNHDLVIALTHIGYSEDKLLAAASKGLDLVIGGHSHTVLESMAIVPNREGREVPVVQTGFNGHFIGKILVEAVRGQQPKILSYELVPVDMEGPRNPEQDRYLQEAEAALERLYGPDLRKPIGKSEVRLVSGDRGPTAFAQFAADAMREATGAELAVDVGAFHGNTPQPAGDVSRFTLMEMYPRKFEQEQNEGHYVYTTKIPGIAIKIGLEYSMRYGYFLSTSGVTYDLVALSDAEYDRLRARHNGRDSKRYLTRFVPKNIKINGEPLRKWRWYRTATSESLVRGAFGITPLAKLLFINARVSPHTIWNAMETHLRKIGTIVALNPGEKMIEDGVFGVESTFSRDVLDEGLEEIMREMP